MEDEDRNYREPDKLKGEAQFVFVFIIAFLFLLTYVVVKFFS